MIILALTLYNKRSVLFSRNIVQIISKLFSGRICDVRSENRTFRYAYVIFVRGVRNQLRKTHKCQCYPILFIIVRYEEPHCKNVWPAGSIDTGQRFPNYCNFKDKYDEYCRVEGVAFGKDGKTVKSANRHIKNECLQYEKDFLLDHSIWMQAFWHI